jgi:predicted transposase/invertase (TIGR01784 family)
MVKFRRLGEKDIRNNRLQRWLAWFDRDSPQGLVEEAVKMDSAIRKAEEKLVYAAGDKETLRAYQMREMALSDWTSGINHAREEGREEGKREIAAKMKKRGVPVGQIAEDTGFSLEEIGRM